MSTTSRSLYLSAVALALIVGATSQRAQAQFFGGGGGFGGGGSSFGGGGSSFGGSFGGGGSFSGGGSSFSGFSGGSSFGGSFGGGGSFRGTSFRGGMGNGGFRPVEPTPVYREPVYVPQPHQPQPVVVTPPPAPKVEPNEVKPLPLEPLENTAEALNVGLSPANRTRAIKDLIEARGNLDVDLEAGLGEALQDKNVAGCFERFVDATTKGYLDDLDRCRRSLESAHSRWLSTTKLTSIGRKQEQRKLQSDLEQQEGVVRALSALTRANGQQQKLQPGSMATILYWPNLANGEMVFVSPDVVFCGVGRSGGMEVRCVNAEDFGSMLGLPLVPGQPLPPSRGSNKTAGVILDNPATSKATVNFNVDGQNISLEPGYFQRLPGGKTYRVTFDRGAGQGNASYALDTGTYQFWSEKNGWDLWKMTFTAVIDNSANRQDFHFMFNDQQMTVKARKTVQLKSPYAVAVKFHNGSGDTPAVRELEKGVFRVGVTEKGLDLFAVNDDAVVRPDDTAFVDPPASENPGTETVASLTPPRTEGNTDVKAAGATPGNGAEEKLRTEMAEVAKAVKQFLDGRGETSIALGKFPASAALNGAAPNAQKTLQEELAKLDVAVKELGSLSIDGRFSDARDRRTQRIGVQLSWQIRDRQEEVLIEAERSIFANVLAAPAIEQTNDN